MSDSNTVRLEAVRTAIDAVIAAAEQGEYMRSYTVGDRIWAGESFKDLLKTLRDEEDDLEKKVAAESATGGSVRVMAFRNEPT